MRALSVVFLLIATLVLTDALGDYRSGGSLGHIAIEVAVAGLALLGVVLIWLQNRRLRGSLETAGREIERLRQESEAWRSENAGLLQGLGAAIDGQFEAWGLTAAETEIAFLLLKGLSLKEIAGVRKTSERTVRQQSLSIYAKSGLSGRAELSAFFLEDLLTPSTRPDSTRAPAR